MYGDIGRDNEIHVWGDIGRDHQIQLWESNR